MLLPAEKRGLWHFFYDGPGEKIIADAEGVKYLYEI